MWFGGSINLMLHRVTMTEFVQGTEMNGLNAQSYEMGSAYYYSKHWNFFVDIEIVPLFTRNLLLSMYLWGNPWNRAGS